MGEGVCSLKSHRKAYQAWSNMLTRGYSKKYKNERTTYKDVTVCEEWHNFQNFAKWFEENYIEGWHLDKDILVKGNKVYSEGACCFVPPEINNLFTKADRIRGKYPIGVYEDKQAGKFKVRISVEGKQKHVGRYYCE